MHSTFLILLAAGAALVSAVPAPKTSPLDKRSWSEGERFWQHRELSSAFIDFARRDQLNSVCSLGNAQMPAANPPLPPPSAGLYLDHVAVGRGTQNYTCDLSNATAVPVAVGAVASLFNVSCTAADSPTLLQQLPGVSLNLPVPATSDHNSLAYQDLSGHHFFSDLTTAVFDLDTAVADYGKGSFKKTNSSPAPAGAIVGQNNQGFGAVAWLKLGAKDPSGQTFQEVYRLNTAGGNPPKTCAGQEAAFEVQYAAEYWVWSK